MNMTVRDRAASTATDFLLDSSFWLPEHRLPSAWLGHAPFAYWLVNVLKPRRIVELGVHRGFSYLVFCQAVSRIGLDCVCRGVDTWQGDEHAGFYGNEVYEDLLKDHRRYDGFSRLIRSEFSAALSRFPDGSIDLLHVDGCHHYESVRRDFETWRPKLSSRAVVLFHDISVSAYGVAEFWKELRNDYPHFEFSHSHGLGVLGFGHDLPIKLMQLFATSMVAPASESVCTAYARLGASISDRQDAERLEQLVRAYETSTSWRMTSPFRVMARFVQRLAHGLSA